MYYRFIVHFPIGKSSSEYIISSSATSASTLSNHVPLGLPTGVLPSTLNFLHFFTQSSSLFLIICPYHLSLPLSNYSCNRLNSAPNDTPCKRWSCHSGYKLLCKLCQNLPPQQWGPDLPFFGQAGHADPLDGWRCSS